MDDLQTFKLSDEDGAMIEWDELVNVHLKGDNLQQFQKRLEQHDSECSLLA